MKLVMAFLACGIFSGAAAAGEVYVTTDDGGHKIYTDTPQAIPAEKLKIHSRSTDPAAVASEYSSETKRYDQTDKANAKARAEKAAAQATSEDAAEARAKRCAEARKQYQVLLDSWRIYEPGANGERTYLSAERIDAERASLKEFMDQACAEK